MRRNRRTDQPELQQDDQPVFPALCLSNDNSISVAENREALSRTNAVALFRNRYFDGLIILDSCAQRFCLVRAEAVPPLSTVARAVVRVLNRRLHAKLQLESELSMFLDDAKELVRIWLDRAPDFCEASRDSEEWRHAGDSVTTARG